MPSVISIDSTNLYQVLVIGHVSKVSIEHLGWDWRVIAWDIHQVQDAGRVTDQAIACLNDEKAEDDEDDRKDELSDDGFLVSFAVQESLDEDGNKLVHLQTDTGVHI